MITAQLRKKLDINLSDVISNVDKCTSFSGMSAAYAAKTIIEMSISGDLSKCEAIDEIDEIKYHMRRQFIECGCKKSTPSESTSKEATLDSMFGVLFM